jgi:polyhydroxyalkanoate synthase
MPKTSETATGKTKPEAAPDNRYAISDPAMFARNMMQVGQQSQKLLADFVKRQSAKGANSGPFDPLNLTGTFTALLKGMAANPTVLLEAQFQLWRDYMGLWERTTTRMLGGEAKPMVAPASGDKRFKDKDWEENQVFDFIKQSYLLTANWMQDTVAKMNGDLDDKTA